MKRGTSALGESEAQRMLRLRALHPYVLEECMQPLQVNLTLEQYQAMMGDPVKYKLYQQAIDAALRDINKSEPIVYVMGAGGGGLVNAALLTKRKMRMYAVEKNNIGVQHLNTRNNTEWNKQVTVVQSDIRKLTIDLPSADLIVSELLGSFGCNEQAPEVLIDIPDHIVTPETVWIPYSYTSFLAPFSDNSTRKALNDETELSNRNKMWNVYTDVWGINVKNTLIDQPQPCFTFVHRGNDKSGLKLEQTAKLLFTGANKFPKSGKRYFDGFMGFFECTLYKDIGFSTVPHKHTTDLQEWTPVVLPVLNPFQISKGDKITCTVLRRHTQTHDKQKGLTSDYVYYEWHTTVNENEFSMKMNVDGQYQKMLFKLINTDAEISNLDVQPMEVDVPPAPPAKLIQIKKLTIPTRMTLDTFRVSAFRSLISSRLFSVKEGSLSEHLLLHQRQFPYEGWGEELENQFSEDRKRASNLIYCIYVIQLALIDLDTLNSIFRDENTAYLSDAFDVEYTEAQRQLEKSKQYERDLKNLYHGNATMDEADPDVTEPLLRDSEAAVVELINCMQLIVEALKALKTDRSEIRILIEHYDIAKSALEKLAEIHFNILKKFTRVDINVFELGEMQRPKELPDWDLALNITRNHLAALISFLKDMVNRFSAVPNLTEYVVAKQIMKANFMLSQLTHDVTGRKSMVEKLKEMEQHGNIGWMIYPHKGKFTAAIYVLVVANFFLHHAIEIIHPCMQGLLFYGQEISANLEKTAARLSGLKVQIEDKKLRVTDSAGKLISVVVEMRECYKLLVAACFFISNVWHFDPPSEKSPDPVWISQAEEVQKIKQQDIDKADYQVVRAGVKYKIKKSNIPEAGLGLFLDEDLNTYSLTKNKLKGSKYGLPLLVYDGDLIKHDLIIKLYGGSDSLRPYSVGSSANEDTEVDSYDGKRHDVARFINDCFNRLPEPGANPDINNPDPRLRTFRYSTHFVWADTGKAESNDDKIVYLRNLNDKKEEKVSRSHVQKDNHSLIIYTIPFESIAATHPEQMYTKGQELWLSYGPEYIQRLVGMDKSLNIDYRAQSDSGFVSQKRNQFDITMQERIYTFLLTTEASTVGQDKESFKDLISRVYVINNVLSMRPYDKSESYFSWALKEVCKETMTDIGVEAYKWINTVHVQQPESTSDYLRELLSNRIFNQKKIHRDLDVLMHGVPMDTIVSILVNVTVLYKACIQHLTNIKESDEEGEPTVRISAGLVDKIASQEMAIGMLKKYATKWYVYNEAMFDLQEWINLFKLFKKDIDSFVKDLDLSGFTFESYQITKMTIDRKEAEEHKLSKAAIIARMLNRAYNSIKPEDYLYNVKWLAVPELTAANTISIVQTIFAKETEQFVKQFRETADKALKALEGKASWAERAWKFDRTVPEYMRPKDAVSAVLTAWAILSLKPDGTIPPKQNEAGKDPSKILDLMENQFKSLFLPPWVYETESNQTGRLAFAQEYNRRKIEYASTKKSNAVISGPMVEVDYTLNLELNLGERYTGDEYARHGYIVEAWVSRELGHNFEMDKQPVRPGINRINHKLGLVPMKYRIPFRNGPESDPNTYLPEAADPQYTALGIVIKGVVYPTDSGIKLKGLPKYDYDAECYIPLHDENVVGKTFPLHCKIFELNQEYPVVGSLTVNKVKLDLGDMEVEGRYSTTKMNKIDEQATDLVNKFFSDITSGEITYNPHESFLRNKHTPIWPNTPLKWMPSSLFALNIPQGENAVHAVNTFMESMMLICSAHDITTQDLMTSFKRVCQASSATNELIIELYGLLRLIGEAFTLLPLLNDYKPDYTRTGNVGEVYQEGVDGISDCEDVGKCAYSLVNAVKGFAFESTSYMYYVKQLLDALVAGVIGCSSSKKAFKDMAEDSELDEAFKGKTHINHVLGGLYPFHLYYDSCMRTGKYDQELMTQYKQRRRPIPAWYDEHMPPLILEGTGYTIPLMKTCETFLSSSSVRDSYIQWARSFLQDHVDIFTRFDKITGLAFQDNSALKYVGHSAARVGFSNFYTKFVHFWTNDMVNHGGPLVTDFIFSHKVSDYWVYDVNFSDYAQGNKDLHLYPMVQFTPEQFNTLVPIAAGMVYPPRFHPVIKQPKRLLDSFGEIEKNAVSVIEVAHKSKISGIMSQTKIFAYLNHIELYTEDKKEEIKSMISDNGNIVGCNVYACRLNETNEMVQFVFYLR